LLTAVDDATDLQTGVRCGRIGGVEGAAREDEGEAENYSECSSHIVTR
jgi:hypothetical protein